MKKIVFIFLFFYSVAIFCQKTTDENDAIVDTKAKPDTSVQDTTLAHDYCILGDEYSFPGGDKAMMKFLKKNTKYPVTAKENGVEGKVCVSFVVNKSGEITNVKLCKGFSEKPKTSPIDTLSQKQLELYAEGARQINEEAMRVVRLMPKWNPGKQNGQPVNTRYMLPITFKLK